MTGDGVEVTGGMEMVGVEEGVLELGELPEEGELG